MTITEAINNIKKESGYTDSNLNDLKESLLSKDIQSFEDPELKYFINFINEEPFDERVQSIIESLVNSLSAKGIAPPCSSHCDDGCAFHDVEFKD